MTPKKVIKIKYFVDVNYALEAMIEEVDEEFEQIHKQDT